MRKYLQVLSQLLCLLGFVCGPGPAHAADNPDWTAPLRPFRITDHVYYVGSRDLASYLIVTPAGNVLLNSNLPSSPAQIRHSVEQLGFRWRDIKILLISHAHFDHAGGSAEIVRQTGARYEVMEGDADVAESGGRTDFAFGPRQQFASVHVDQVLHDGDRVTLGGVTLTAHRTAGHTRGCTTWTMDDHMPSEPAAVQRHIVIVGSWNVLSEYRLVAQRSRPPSYPGIAADFEKTFAVLQSLPCDVFLGAHGSYFGMLPKLDRMPAEGDRTWIDPEGFRRAVAERKEAFQQALARQQAAATGTR